MTKKLKQHRKANTFKIRPTMAHCLADELSYAV